MELFGFNITRKGANTAAAEKPSQQSFVAKQDDDGATVVTQAGAYGQYIDMDGTITSDSELITRYRTMALHPTLDIAITAIVNEAIVNEPEEETVTIDLDKVEAIGDSVKTKIEAEFKNILRLYNFNLNGYDIFRRWYVDGRIFYHAIVDKNNQAKGIQELRFIDPRKIRKIREIEQKPVGNSANLGDSVRQLKEYYAYNDKGFTKQDLSTVQNTGTTNAVLKIDKNAIVHVTSGQMDVTGKQVVSYLHKAIRPLNILTMMEDAGVIYRIVRAPERRVFYINTAGMPAAKAEQHLRTVMNNFKNKLVYDSANGEIRDQRKFMTMFEDFWLHRRDGDKSTEITTLPAGQNLGEIEDIIYFQRRLYQSLNIPISRIDPESMYSIGRGTEINREEVGFEKFITRLRARFSLLFLNTLRVQLLLKRIISSDDWEAIKNDIQFQYAKDNLFAELKDNEIWMGRLAIAEQLEAYIGRYVSNDWVRRNIFKQTDAIQKEEDKKIQGEEGMSQYAPRPDPNGDQGGDPDMLDGDLTRAGQ